MHINRYAVLYFVPCSITYELQIIDSDWLIVSNSSSKSTTFGICVSNRYKYIFYRSRTCFFFTTFSKNNFIVDHPKYSTWKYGTRVPGTRYLYSTCTSHSLRMWGVRVIIGIFQKYSVLVLYQVSVAKRFYVTISLFSYLHIR